MRPEERREDKEEEEEEEGAASWVGPTEILESGGVPIADHYGLDDRELALACSSHGAEAIHCAATSAVREAQNGSEWCRDVRRLCDVRVRDLVLFGDLVPGQPVTIDGLREILGSGITPVREAIRRLSAEGALETGGNRRVRGERWGQGSRYRRGLLKDPGISGPPRVCPRPRRR